MGLKNYHHTGIAAFGGYILGFHEVDRRGLMNVFHEGAIIFVLMAICIVSSLVVYDWVSCLVRKHLLGGTGASQVGSDVSGHGTMQHPFRCVLLHDIFL